MNSPLNVIYSDCITHFNSFDIRVATVGILKYVGYTPKKIVHLNIHLDNKYKTNKTT